MLSTVRMQIGSSPPNIARVQRALGELLTEHGAGEALRDRFELAVGEAVANAIVHGNRSRPERPVVVEITLERGVLAVDVEDEGDGFDPAAVADPRDPERLLRSHGRGLLLIAAAFDEIRCEPRAGGGSVVALRARLATLPLTPRRKQPWTSRRARAAT